MKNNPNISVRDVPKILINKKIKSIGSQVERVASMDSSFEADVCKWTKQESFMYQ